MKTGKVGSLVSKNAGTKNRLLNIPQANIKSESCDKAPMLNIGPKLNSSISKR